MAVAREKSTIDRQPATFEATGAGIATGQPMGEPVQSSRDMELSRDAESQVSQWSRSAPVGE